MPSALKDRLLAFIIHLGLSCLIALCVVGLIFFVWYPAPLHRALGVTHVFLLLLLVDVVMGPVLTAIVYKKGKRTLLLDLSVIAVLQLSALGYGLHAIAEARPGWLVFGGYHFELVKAADIEPAGYPASWTGPEWVALPPSNVVDQILGISSQEDPYYVAARHVPLAQQQERLARNAQPLSALENGHNTSEQLKHVQHKWPAADAWVPLSTGAQDLVVLIHKETGQVQGIADLRPW